MQQIIVDRHLKLWTKKVTFVDLELRCFWVRIIACMLLIWSLESSIYSLVGIFRLLNLFVKPFEPALPFNLSSGLEFDGISHIAYTLLAPVI